MGRYPAVLDRSSEFGGSGKNDAEAGWIGYVFGKDRDTGAQRGLAENDQR